MITYCHINVLKVRAAFYYDGPALYFGSLVKKMIGPHLNSVFCAVARRAQLWSSVRLSEFMRDKILME